MVPATIIIKAIPNHCIQLSVGKNRETKKVTINTQTAPPRLPSQVFFGDSRKNKGRLPKYLPAK